MYASFYTIFSKKESAIEDKADENTGWSIRL